MANKRLAIQRVHTGDFRRDAEQDHVRAAATAFNAVPFARGTIISVSLAAATATIVNHRLGVPAAFLIVRQNYAPSTTYARIYEHADQTGLDAKNQIRVKADILCKLDLWFYPRASHAVPSGKTQAP